MPVIGKEVVCFNSIEDRRVLFRIICNGYLACIKWFVFGFYFYRLLCCKECSVLYYEKFIAGKFCIISNDNSHIFLPSSQFKIYHILPYIVGKVYKMTILLNTSVAQLSGAGKILYNKIQQPRRHGCNINWSLQTTNKK